MEKLNPILILKAYSVGIFPMARSADDDEVLWVDPEMRGIIPLDNFHVSKSLKKILKKHEFEIRFNSNFEQVINLCAEKAENRTETWINKEIKELYIELHHMGFAHSVECIINGELAGGLYGVSLGRAFFGESMFSKVSNASKISLCYLVAKLRACGFTLLDAQFITKHLEQFGAIEITRNDYIKMLNKAIEKIVSFNSSTQTDIEDVINKMIL